MRTCNDVANPQILVRSCLTQTNPPWGASQNRRLTAWPSITTPATAKRMSSACRQPSRSRPAWQHGKCEGSPHPSLSDVWWMQHVLLATQAMLALQRAPRLDSISPHWRKSASDVSGLETKRLYETLKRVYEDSRLGLGPGVVITGLPKGSCCATAPPSIWERVKTKGLQHTRDIPRYKGYVTGKHLSRKKPVSIAVLSHFKPGDKPRQRVCNKPRGSTL